MRKTGLAWGIIAALAVWPTAEAAVTSYKAILTGVNEFQRVATRGRGTAAVNADPASHEISWNVAFTGLSGPVISAYIRCESRTGERAAGIAVPLGSGSSLQSPLTGSGTLDDARFADLQNGRCYVNVVTAAHEGGEISGRLHR
jgi:CHRD domain